MIWQLIRINRLFIQLDWEAKPFTLLIFRSGEIKGLVLPYPAERLALSNHKLYVTQHKMAHEYNTGSRYQGAIAEVDTTNFTATRLIDIDTDPYDIAIDKNGYAFIAPDPISGRQ